MSQDHVAAALASEDRRFAAQASADIAVLGEVIADDLHYTHATGVVEDKATFIGLIANGERCYRALRVIHRTASGQPGFVAVFGQLEVEATRPEGMVVSRIDYTAIYRDADARLFAWSAVGSVPD